MSDLVYYTACGILIIGVLAGIARMSKVKSSVKGNALSAVCIAIAILLTLYKSNILSDYMLWVFIAVGLVMGLVGAYKIKMIDMPQTIALFNGFGGAASALVAAVSLLNDHDKGHGVELFSLITAGLALSVGVITLTGSIVAGGKLHKILPQKPVVWKKHQMIITVSILLAVISILAMAFVSFGSTALLMLVVACTLFSGFFGVAFAIRVGGADMPITISLLNSLSGVAGAITGMAISDPLLVAVGGVVGASGLLLTQIMCCAMNRSLEDTLLGRTSMTVKPTSYQQTSGKGTSERGTAEQLTIEQRTIEQRTIEQRTIEQRTIEQGATERVTIEQRITEQGTSEQGTSEKGTSEQGLTGPEHKEDPAQLLSEAKKVIIIPGYGLALAQAQEHVKQLADKLEANGTEVLFAIHPVAGRMPGHMNVLLCEVDIPYDKLREMDEINPQFSNCDVAVIIGANDVVNPAANTAEGTPIYGMPVLEVGKAKHIIICNYDSKPGYSGVENPLYSKTQGVTLLFGDAKEALAGLLLNL